MIEDFKISVIVPVYNTHQYLDKCINSLINQTLDGIEIILINDGSTDDSGNICDKYASKNKNIVVVHQDNMGVSSTRNKGIHLAKGEYIGFVDSDDYIELNMYEMLFNAINQENTDLGICLLKENKFKLDEEILTVSSQDEVISLCCGKIVGGYVCNKLFKKKIIIENNIKFRNDIHICEDYLFCLDYIQYCERASFCKRMLYHYVYRNDSATKIGFSLKRWTGLKAYDFILAHSCVQQNDKVKQGVENDYIKYCLWLIKAIIINKPSLANEYLFELKNRVKKYLYKFIKTKQISYKYKIALLIFYLYPLKEKKEK